MTNLTEQWNKGVLHDGDYYIKRRNGDTLRDNIDSRGVWRNSIDEDIIEVLAEVPSYQDYERLNWYAGDGVEENAKLKELLKECKGLLSCLQIDDYDNNGLLVLTKINQVLGE